jgi:hypothetical protein
MPPPPPPPKAEDNPNSENLPGGTPTSVRAQSEPPRELRNGAWRAARDDESPSFAAPALLTSDGDDDDGPFLFLALLLPTSRVLEDDREDDDEGFLRVRSDDDDGIGKRWLSRERKKVQKNANKFEKRAGRLLKGFFLKRLAFLLFVGRRWGFVYIFFLFVFLFVICVI